MAYEATPWDAYTTNALNQAQGLMSTPAAEYPTYKPTQSQSPASYQYYNYNPTTPMASISTPTYQGMMGGDYDKLQEALTTPGANAATGAYNTGMQGLNNAMSGRGLYGSSIMGNQQVQGLDKVYQQALANNAANAAGQRYTLQQADLDALNKFNAQNYATGIDQNKNLWTANAAENANRQAYDSSKLGFNMTQDEQLRKWQNAQEYEKYTYDLARNAYNNQATESLMNRALALAGQGAPLSAQATNYQIAEAQNQAAMQAAREAASAQNTTAWLGAGGSALGGLLGGYSNWNSTAGNNGGIGTYLSSLIG